MGFELEVCVGRVDDALVATAAGATRIEMNVALESSGLTPSVASCRWLAKNCSAPVIAMLRPHDDGFLVSAAEKQCMLSDAAALLSTGIAGIAFGATVGTELDVAFLHELCTAAQTANPAAELVLHRAFDTLADLRVGLEQAIELGFDRILTSGGKTTALEGADELRALAQQAAGRIEILPAAGITAFNAIEVLRTSCCGQLHGSFKRAGATPIQPDAEQISRVWRMLGEGVER